MAVAFTTRQAVRHDGRSTGYRNEVLGLRVGAAVGSCAVEPGALDDDVVEDCAGAGVDRLLRHPLTPVRVAALDAYLMHVTPHTRRTAPCRTGARRDVAREVPLAGEGGRRAAGPAAGGHGAGGRGGQLAAGGSARPRLGYIPCDFKGGVTEWDEDVVTDALSRRIGVTRCWCPG